MKKSKSFQRLATLMAMPALDGYFMILAGAGMMTLTLAPVHALSAIAGPMTLIQSLDLDGTIGQRVTAGILAGLIATVAVVAAVILGSKAGNLINMKTLRISGALSLIAISAILLGLKIPEKAPLVIMLSGLLLSVIMR